MTVTPYVPALSDKLSVHATEDLVKSSPEIKSGTRKKAQKNTELTEKYAHLTNQATAFLQAKVAITSSEKGAGKMTIAFKSNDDLARILEIFKNGSH